MGYSEGLSASEDALRLLRLPALLADDPLEERLDSRAGGAELSR